MNKEILEEVNQGVNRFVWPGKLNSYISFWAMNDSSPRADSYYGSVGIGICKHFRSK